MASQEYEISFQQGVDGYSGTVDTQLNQKKPDRDYSTKSEIEVEADSNGDKQVLLRFDDLFDPGGIPDGAQILSATLTLQTTGAGDGASIHQMLTSWSETSTWNSLAGGISADGVEAVAAADVATGPTSAGAGSFDVTSSVQAWASGADNNGWVFQALGESGWDFETSEGSIRPQLTIRYTLGTSGVNQDPTAVADVAQVAEGGSIAIDVLANDSDDDGDTLNVTQVGSAANGVATINPNNTITYVPTAGFSGSDSFNYTVSDGKGGTDSATVNVTVVADNTTAVIGGTVSGGITEDANPTTLATSGIATIVDPDAGEDSFQTASGTTTYGNFSIASNGSWTYSAANGQNAIQSLSEGQTLTDSFVITSLDGSASETVQIVITGVNDTPVAATDSVQVNQNNSTTINVLANDSDIDGDTLTVSQVGNPANGVATINPNNTITYTPTAGFSGSDSFNYTVSDGKGGTNSTTVAINVSATLPSNSPESYIAVADGGSSRNLEHDNASKSFFHDGTWWGVLPSIEGNAWAVYQFSEAVPDTGDLGGWTVSSDPLANSDHLADIAWDSTSETLFVLQFDTEQPYLFQLGYDQSSQTWATENFVNLSTTLDTGYWADNADLALGVDQQGNPLILGITSGSGSEKGLHVAYSTSSDLGSWDFTTVDSDTTSSGGTNGNSKADFVTFSQNGVDKVGIVYSQDGGDNTWSFTWHDASLDSSNYDSGWSTEVITSSVGIDDHVSAVSDGTTIYAAVKDGNNAVWLLKGQPGNWDDPIKVINGGVSRPVIVLDESKQEIYIMYMDQSEVYMKATSALNPQFDTSDAGVKVLEIAGSGRADDPQGPVHPVGDDTDGYFVVFAKNQSTDAVWYNDVDLSADLWTA